MKLNLLRTSCQNPNLSAYAFLDGNYDFKKHPIAPQETKVVIRNKPSKCGSWGYHGKDGFYDGLALEHYTCVQCLSTKSCCVKTAGTVHFFPDKTLFPKINLED